MAKKFSAAISDTDLLIHLAKANHFEILDYLFDKVYIPSYILDVELRKKAGKYFDDIKKLIDANSIFEIKDRNKDRVVNILAKPIIDEKSMIVGRGESECAGYASALGVEIIISDNYTEFKYLDEYIMLTYYHIISLCVYFKCLDLKQAIKIYDDINAVFDHSSGINFETRYKRCMEEFKVKGWNKYFGIAE